MRLIDWLPFGRVAEIEPEVLAGRLEAGEALQVIDVRTGLEYRSGHIPDAVHVPVQRLKGALATLGLDGEVPIITVCKTAHRSIPAVRLLRGHGFAAVQLAGGLDRWRQLGLPIVTGERP